VISDHCLGLSLFVPSPVNGASALQAVQTAKHRNKFQFIFDTATQQHFLAEGPELRKTANP